MMIVKSMILAAVVGAATSLVNYQHAADPNTPGEPHSNRLTWLMGFCACALVAIGGACVYLWRADAPWLLFWTVAWWAVIWSGYGLRRAWINARDRRAVLHRYHGKPILRGLFILLMPLALLAGGGCASNVTQQQQFQQSVTFWSSEVTTLRKAVEALPPGSQRDKALKDLQTAEFWVAFFTPLLNPPATQPVATVK